jgi:hypothetical protein
MNKLLKLIFVLSLLVSCKPDNKLMLEKYTEAINNYNKTQLIELLSEDFISEEGRNKKLYLQKIDSLQQIGMKSKILSIIDNDSVIITTEEITITLDTILEISPRKIYNKRYRLYKGLITAIKFDSINNVTDYKKAYADKFQTFAFFVKSKFGDDITNTNILYKNLPKYASEYSKILPEEKQKLSQYANLQGAYISKDNPFYRKLVFRGRSTVTVVDNIFGISFSSSYTLDEGLIRIRTDKSDLLLTIKDSNTLIGEGFAKGTFKRNN